MALPFTKSRISEKECLAIELAERGLKGLSTG
jgi:hypothetical protein